MVSSARFSNRFYNIGPQWLNKGVTALVSLFNIRVLCLCTCLNNFSYPSLVVAEIGS